MMVLYRNVVKVKKETYIKRALIYYDLAFNRHTIHTNFDITFTFYPYLLAFDNLVVSKITNRTTAIIISGLLL